jgi:hypothetical protein
MQVKLTKISYMETLFEVGFIQDSSLLRVQFRQVYTGFQSTQGSV